MTCISSTKLVIILTSGQLQLKPSLLRPDCRAEERIFQWRGVNSPLPSTIDAPIIQLLASLASQASLWDASGYGSGL
jgi:hypothetical protein